MSRRCVCRFVKRRPNLEKMKHYYLQRLRCLVEEIDRSTDARVEVYICDCSCTKYNLCSTPKRPPTHYENSCSRCCANQGLKIYLINRLKTYMRELKMQCQTHVEVILYDPKWRYCPNQFSTCLFNVTSHCTNCCHRSPSCPMKTACGKIPPCCYNN